MKKKRGFTLIEVLASFLIISILSTSITAVILNSIRTTKDRRLRIIATSVAENYIHDIKDSLDSTNTINLIPKSMWQTVTKDDPSASFKSTNTVELNRGNIDLYLSSSTIVKDKLYGNSSIVLDGTKYDSSVVTISLGVKRYQESSKDYEIVVAVVKIMYNGTRTMEVVRDVY